MNVGCAGTSSPSLLSNHCASLSPWVAAAVRLHGQVMQHVKLLNSHSAPIRGRRRSLMLHAARPGEPWLPS